MEITILISSVILCCLIYIIVILTKQNTIKLKPNKEIPLSSVIPIERIEDNFIINGNGDITAGYKLFLPELFTLSDNAVEGIHESLSALFKILPAGTVIHQQTFIYIDAYKSEQRSDNVLFNDNLRSLQGKEIINSYSNIYLTFTNSEKKRNPNDNSLLRKLNYPFQKPYNIDFENIQPIILNFENGLMAINEFDFIRMTSIDLNNAVFDFLNMSYNEPTQNASKNVVDPIGLSSSGDFKIGNRLVAILSLIEEGNQLHQCDTPRVYNMASSSIEIPAGIRSNCGMMYTLGLGLPFNHILNTIIEITDTDDTLAALAIEKRNLNMLSNFYPPAKIKQTEIEAFSNEVTKRDLQTTYTAINLIIEETDKIGLNQKISLAKQAFSSMNQSQCYLENEETANLFFCSIPGNARSNYRGFVNTTLQAICYLNKENLYVSSKTGHLFHDRFGTPVLIDLWKLGKRGMDNRNRILIGPSGSGKSFWTNNYTLQSIIQGKDVIIIDIGGSYKNLILINNGKYYDSRISKEFQFNPFLCPKDRNGNYNYTDNDEDEDFREDFIKTIVAVLSFIWKEKQEIKPIERAILAKSVKEFYSYVNKNSLFPNMINYKKFISSFYETLDDYEKDKFNVHELQILLEPYTDGELSYLLNAENNIDITNDTLIAYDMEDIKGKDHFPIIAIMTLQVIIDKIKRRLGIPKTLIIDEALDFLSDQKFGDFIGYLYRTFRKKEGEILIAAQNVKFIQNAAPTIRDSILINSDTKIILEHGKKYWDNLSDLSFISISEQEIEQIKSLQRDLKWRDFFIKVGNESYVLRNAVSELCASAFNSEQKTIIEIQRLFHEKGSIYAALHQYVENNKNGVYDK